MGKEKLKTFKDTVKSNKSTFAVYVILRLIVVAALVVALLRNDFETAYLCGLTLILFLLPAVIERAFNLELPSALEIIILLFIFSAEILGEIGYFYVRVPHWDTLLHTVNGFICGAVGFALVDLLNKNKNIKFSLSPIFVSVVAFCFSMTIGVLWEFLEFGCDMLLHTDMQKDFIVNELYSVALDATKTNRTVHFGNITELSLNGQVIPVKGYIDIGLLDTMKDLLVNFVGAVVFSIIGFFYIKNRGKGKFAEKFIPKLKDEKTDK